MAFPFPKLDRPQPREGKYVLRVWCRNACGIASAFNESHIGFAHQAAKQAGWRLLKNGLCICPDCDAGDRSRRFKNLLARRLAKTKAKKADK